MCHRNRVSKKKSLNFGIMSFIVSKYFRTNRQNNCVTNWVPNFGEGIIALEPMRQRQQPVLYNKQISFAQLELRLYADFLINSSLFQRSSLFFCGEFRHFRFLKLILRIEQLNFGYSQFFFFRTKLPNWKTDIRASCSKIRVKLQTRSKRMVIFQIKENITHITVSSSVVLP